MYTSDIFIFKQKTAYEIRISDLSSDVCSSDLGPRALRTAAPNRKSSASGSAGIPIWSCCSQRSRPSRNGVAEAEQICYLAGCKLPEGHPCSSLRHCAIRAGKGGSPKWSQIGRASCRERVCRYV